MQTILARVLTLMVETWRSLRSLEPLDHAITKICLFIIVAKQITIFMIDEYFHAIVTFVC